MPRPAQSAYELSDAEKRDLIKLIESGARIPTGFRPQAQGCEARATLGNRCDEFLNPIGVVAVSSASFPCRRRRNPIGVGFHFAPFTQGSSSLATLGYTTQSLWDCPTRIPTQIFNGISNQCPASAPRRIPTGFRPKAQGWRARAYLGKTARCVPNPNGDAATHR